jgi:flagellar biosynthetic protein FlhB
MAEEMGDKTEAPTPRRRLEAREQGNVPRSADLTAAVLLIGVLMLLNNFGSGLVKALRTIIEEMLGAASLTDLNQDGVGAIFIRAIFSIGRAIAPFFIGVMLLAVIVNLAQTGLIFSTQRIQPNFTKLNPLRGLSKIFSGGQGVVRLLMNLMKLSLVGLMAYSAIHGRLSQIILIQELSFNEIFSIASGLIYAIALRIGVLLLVLALLDYVYQRFRIEKELKMSKSEVKEEMKRMEGDPAVKGRRRQLALARHRERMKNDVPKADVVVTNPTEFAIALKYDADSMAAPRVVAKGQGYFAAQIRQLAIAHGIPILERKPLARALYKMCKVGDEIPEQFFAAVAEILAYVYEITGKIRKKELTAA